MEERKKNAINMAMRGQNEVFVGLDPNLSLKLLVSRADGRPYMRLTRTKEGEIEMMHLSLDSFNALCNAAEEIEKKWNSGDCQARFRLPPGALATVVPHTKSKEPELCISRVYMTDTFPTKFHLSHAAFRKWMAHSEELIKWMTDVEHNRNAHAMKFAQRLNFNTKAVADQHPPGLILVREVKDGKDRTFTLPRSVVEKLKAMADEIKENLQQMQESEFPLSETHHVSTALFNERMYVCLYKVNGEGRRERGNGMNMDSYAFETLIRTLGPLVEGMDRSIWEKKNTIPPVSEARLVTNAIMAAEREREEKLENLLAPPMKKRRISVEHVDEGFEEEEVKKQKEKVEEEGIFVLTGESEILLQTPEKGKQKGEQPPTPSAPKRKQGHRVMMYTWAWITENGVRVKNAKFWYLCETMCMNDAQRFKPPYRDDVHLKVETKWAEKPKMRELLNKLLSHYLTLEIQKLQDKTCLGCLYNSPGQKAHMDGGCLEEWETAVATKLKRALEHVGNCVTICWARNVMEAMGFPFKKAEFWVRTWKEEVEHDTLIMSLTSGPVTDTYKHFFNMLFPFPVLGQLEDN